MPPWKGNIAEKTHTMRANVHLYKMWQTCEKWTFAFSLHFFLHVVALVLPFLVAIFTSLFWHFACCVNVPHFCLLNFARTGSTAYHTGETSRATSQDFERFDGICAFQLVRLSLFRYRIQPFVERLIREQLTAALYRKAEPGSKPKPKIHQDIRILPGSVKDI